MDKRRESLFVPYVKAVVVEEDGSGVSNTLSNSLPMLAMFTRNSMLAWTSLVVATQSYIAQKPAAAQSSSQPAWMKVLLSVFAIVVSYIGQSMRSSRENINAIGTHTATTSA